MERLRLSQAQGGLNETMLDMVLGLHGALVFLASKVKGSR